MATGDPIDANAVPVESIPAYTPPIAPTIRFSLETLQHPIFWAMLGFGSAFILIYCIKKGKI